MSEPKSVTPLELRKRILLMESDLNRAQLCHDCALLAEDLQILGEQVGSMTTLASSFFSTFGPEKNGGAEEAPAPGKPSWISTLVKGVRFGTSLWLAYRSKS